MNTSAPVLKPALEDDEAFCEKLLDRHAQQPKLVLLPVSLTALAIAGIAATVAPLRWVFAWLSLVAIVLVVRWLVVGRLNQPRGRSARQRLRIAVGLMALSGITHASSLAFFPYLPQFERALHSMLLVGLSAGCVATASGYPPIFRAYTIATLGPLAILWALSPGPAEAAWVQSVMAVIMVLFAVAFDLLARDTFKLFKESYDYRLELQSALDAAQKANRAKTRFLASASHDLRQPMQTLSLFAAALAMRPLDERSRVIAGHMNDALRDLTGELDALLDISKLDAGVVRTEPALSRLHSILERVFSIYRPAAEQKNLTLTMSCCDDLCVNVDRKLLERILRNLVENAIKYTDPSGTVQIAATPHGEHCVVSIVDTGCGIPEPEQERVFEEFYQLDNPERDRSRGLGLGLAIVQRLVDLMGIAIALRSTPGVGSTFELTLRIEQVHFPACHEVQGQAGALDGMRIVVVDDEESVRLGMQSMLDEFGCRSILAADTAEAVRLVQRDRPDLLIADFRLRGSDSGLRTIAEMHRLHPDLPALLLTGDTAPDRLREARDAGVPMLHKPVAAQALLHEIRRLTNNNRSGNHGSEPGSAAQPHAVDLEGIRSPHL